MSTFLVIFLSKSAQNFKVLTWKFILIKSTKNFAVSPVSTMSSIIKTFFPFKSGRAMSTALTLPDVVVDEP